MTYVEVIVFIALALYLGLLLYFTIQREKKIMKLNSIHANSRSTHESDLISRADAISVLIRWLSGEGGDIIELIESLPSADAVQGEWIEEDEYGDLWVCDQCGFASEYKSNFCSNCGARMKGGDDE